MTVAEREGEGRGEWDRGSAPGEKDLPSKDQREILETCRRMWLDFRNGTRVRLKGRFREGLTENSVKWRGR